MSEEQKKKEIIKQKTKQQVERVKAMFSGIREGWGISPRTKWREVFKSRIHREPQQGKGITRPSERFQSSTAESGQLLEKIQNRPKPLIGFLQNRQQQPQPQLTEAQLIVLQEHEAELTKKAEQRKQDEEKKLKEQEDAQALKKANQKWSVQVGGGR